MSREMELEYNRWQLLCEEAQKVGIDPNNKKFNRAFRAIALWGESLVQLRLTQTKEQTYKALSMAAENWKKVSKQS